MNLVAKEVCNGAIYMFCVKAGIEDVSYLSSMHDNFARSCCIPAVAAIWLDTGMAQRTRTIFGSHKAERFSAESRRLKMVMVAIESVA